MVGRNCESKQFKEDEEYVTTPEEAPLDATLSVRAHDADTGAYLSGVYVYIDGVYNGMTLGSYPKLFTISPGYHTIKLAKDGYISKVINTWYLTAGTTFTVDGSLDPEITTGTLEVGARVKDGTDVITGANIRLGTWAGSIFIPDTGYTTPHTFTLDAGTYNFLTEKEHFINSQTQTVTIGAGDSKTETCEMTPSGLQCDIDLLTTGEGVTIPDKFALPTPGSLTPTFGFKMPFNVGNFTYYGIGWAVLNEPAPHIVTSALVDSMVVKVNGIEITPVITGNSINGDISFDLFAIIKTLIENGSIAADLTQLKIDITYATRLWFETGNHTNNSALYTETQTILIPVAALGLCSFAPAMSGPAEIPITLPLLPSLPPVIGASVLDINLGALCENLTTPPAVPIKLFLFGSDTPAISTNVSPTSYTPDISSYILQSITAMISAGTPIPDTISVLLRCPEGYTPSGFSTTMTETGIAIPLSAPTPGKTVCGVNLTTIDPAGIVVSKPELGLPGLNIATLPITGVMGIVCKENGASIPTPPWIVPPDVDLYVMDSFVTTLSVDPAGNFTHDIINLINPATLIDQNITTISVMLLYPSVVWIEGVTTVEDVDLIEKRISIPVSLPGLPPGPKDIFCDITADLTAPDTIPLDVTMMLPPGAPDLIAYLDMSATCDQGAPADPFSGLYATAAVNGVSLSYLYPDSGGKCSLNLATLWSTIMSTIASGASTIELEIQYPKQVKYSTPSVQDWGTKTKTINLDISGPPPGECQLTPDDYITCDDGNKIPIRMCLPDGSKVNIFPTPTCPELPEPECYLSGAADFYTCPDGTVIQLNECRNGVKVPTGETCPPPAPPAPPAPPVDTRSKTVYVTTPMVTRAGKRVSVVAFVRCGIEKSSGEEATVTVNGEIITTARTKNGKVNATWIPVVAGLYTICVDVPASSICGTGSSSCTYIRVVSELSPPEIEAAEEEFSKAQERIGEIMERI